MSVVNYIKKAMSVPVNTDQAHRDLIRYEAQIGGKLFGPIPKNRRREFFCLDEQTWIWHEEWVDGSGNKQIVTTRYDVRPHGIFKAQDNMPYRRVVDEELDNFYHAAKLYIQKVSAELERRSSNETR